MRINPNLKIEELREKFEKEKVLEINDFLVEEDAEMIWRFLFYEMPEDWWYRSIFINREKNTSPKHIRKIPENENEIKELSILAADSFTQGLFSYVFDRTTNNHHAGCPCVECQFRKFSHSPEVLNLISIISNYKLSKSNELFASKYTSGCFLSPHHDIDRGKIGFVYNLSKKWKPEYGANLHIMDYDYFTVKKIIVPKFNNLVIFDIPSYNGVPHFVSHVAPNVDNKRISITGWFE
jgi:hypothetical protein